jgi:hypothetical protein
MGVTSLKLSVFARLGGLCGSDADCAADLRCAPDGACQPGEEGDTCASSYVPATGGGDCNAFAPSCVQGACRNGSEGDDCSVDQECASGLGCGATSAAVYDENLGTYGEQPRLCIPRCGATQSCAAGLHCVDGLCHDGSLFEPCTASADCVEPLVCDPRFDSCVRSDGNPGDPCSEAADCDQSPSAQICHQEHCSAPSVGTPCETQSECGTQELPWFHHGLVCIQDVCHDGSLGAPCSDDTHCISRYCHDGHCDGDSGDSCETWNQVYPSCYAPYVCIDNECDVR